MRVDDVSGAGRGRERCGGRVWCDDLCGVFFESQRGVFERERERDMHWKHSVLSCVICGDCGTRNGRDTTRDCDNTHPSVIATRSDPRAAPSRCDHETIHETRE